VSFVPTAFDTKQQIKEAVDIVDLVGDYLQLRREGRIFKALCPWHDDSRPSLQVNPQRQSWKCWVCNIGGDVFSFVEKIEGVEFREALSMLAERTGIPLPARRGGLTTGPATDEKQILYQAMAWAVEQYHQCLLQAPQAEPARQYLADRGIADQSIARFQLGYAPDDWEWLLKRARGTPFKPPILEKVGLIRSASSGQGYYEPFKGRVLFTIRDAQRRPRPVGLGGRVLPGSTHPAKYVNSNETPIFTKSNLLYGLDVAREAIERSKVALVMEGYTDCIIAHQCGFSNAVAVLGTALGERHIKLLRNVAERIVLVLDGDEAGKRRANEVLQMFVAEQIDLRIMTLPDDLDPCDYLLQHGAGAFGEQMQTAVDALEHKFRVATEGLQADSSLHQLQRAAEEVLATLAQAPRLQTGGTSEARVREDQVLHRLARRCDVAEEVLRSRLRELRGGSRPRSPSASGSPAASEPPLPLIERLLLELLLLAPEGVAEAREQILPQELQNGLARIILAKCFQLADTGVLPSFERLMLEFDEPAVKNLLVELDEQGREKQSGDARAALADLLARFRRRQWEQEFKAHRAAVAERRIDDDAALAVLSQIIAHKKAEVAVQRDGTSE
jgi:DNA primase